ncbi:MULTISPECIES: IclR family transcriptional regulator [Corynebacterium]|uniref:IclR family transcriptional regulator n=1 Tax=Corynebacterium TaxID=1716 RepID=UPI00124F2346|nr:MULTISPECIES: IclR family transcriptional regulator [Corynebacterium]
MGKFNSLDGQQSSGIKVLDRTVLILNTVANSPQSLSELCERTQLPRATAHRLATALEMHDLLSRTSDGKWSIGSALRALGASSSDKLIDAAAPIMANLMETTQESVQLYRLNGTMRTCVAAQEPSSGLQNTVPVGFRMPLTAGSAARVFVAYAPPHLRDTILRDAHFTTTDLEQVRAQGYADSVSEREVGLASVSAPIFDGNGELLAVLSVSGPAERLGPNPGARHGQALLEASRQLSGTA